jgi:hypothetical protein
VAKLLDWLLEQKLLNHSHKQRKCGLLVCWLYNRPGYPWHMVERKKGIGRGRISVRDWYYRVIGKSKARSIAAAGKTIFF